MKSHRFHPAADGEYTEAVTYYADKGLDLGLRFFQEIETVIAEVKSAPRRFRKFDPPAHRHFSNRFPYAVIYLIEPDHIWIVAVMHLHRAPGYWREREG